MRNKEVVEAFFRHEKANNSTGSLWSTGDRLLSYATCIAEYDKNGDICMNMTKYSVTTSHHQTLVKRQFPKIDRYFYDIDRGRAHILPADERRY